jgi:Protein of unknown function (DUF3285)
MENQSVEVSPVEASPVEASYLEPSEVAGVPNLEVPDPKDSYVKLAMRNMVRKSSTSLFHFALTTIALLGVLVGLAYLTR